MFYASGAHARPRTGQPLAASRLRQAVERPDDLAVRQRDQPAGDTAHRGTGAERLARPDGAARLDPAGSAAGVLRIEQLYTSVLLMAVGGRVLAVSVTTSSADGDLCQNAACRPNFSRNDYHV